MVYYTKINQQTFAINVLDVTEALHKKANNKTTIIKEKENCDKWFVKLKETAKEEKKIIKTQDERWKVLK